MSTTYYNQKWQEAISDLLHCVDQENYPLDQNLKDKGLPYKRTDLTWFQYYAALYIRYLDIYRKLEDSYDQMVHPQKRLLMKQMLDNSIVRMCQLKQNIIRYSTSTQIVQADFINIDEVLIEMKLTPKALDVPLPRFFLDGSSTRDLTIQRIIKQLNVSQQIERDHDAVALDNNSEVAIRIIQKLERGRQGILRGLEFNKIKHKIHKDRSAQLSNEEDHRAQIVQKYWRAFLSRRLIHKIRQQQMQFLGIEKEHISKTLLQKAQEQRDHLKAQQKMRENQFYADKDKIKNQIKRTEEPSIKAAMLDQRRKWMKNFLQMHQFSNLPANSQDFYKNKTEKVQDVNQKKGAKEKKQEPKGKGKKSQIDKFLDEHVDVGPTEQVVKLQQQINQYTSTWGSMDSSEISDESYDAEIAKNQIRPEVQDQLEKLVDGLINLQLDNMRIKYGIKKKKEKKKKKKSKKQKKIKIPQGLGKKDPQLILEQLFEKNIAKLLSGAKINDFLGEHNPITYMIEKNCDQMPDPALSQVRNLVAEYVGIPLGSQIAKEKLQKWTWFLFYGAMGTGKTLLIRALHKETNAIVFDLTPEVVKQKYTEKSQLTRLIWSVIICAKQFQPSIVMIDDFDTIFSGVKGKKTATSSFGPRMKKIITDMKKNKLWTKTDQIAVVACTNRPYDSSLKDMKKMFDKKIYFPYPNYATRKLLIQQFIEEKCNNASQDFPYQTFAHVSEGFTAGSIKKTVDKVLTPMRLQRLKDQPLRLNEIISPLSNSVCVFAQEYQKIKKFTDEVTGLKDRLQSKKEPAKDEKKKPSKK